GLSLKVFFDKYLAVNWWCGDTNVYVLAPALCGEKKGHEYPADPRGTCVFLKDDRCQIHAAKPYDCAHGNPHEGASDHIPAQRAFVVAAWRKRQGQIVKLLGRKPVPAEMSLSDLFSLMLR